MSQNTQPPNSDTLDFDTLRLNLADGERREASRLYNLKHCNPVIL